MTTEKLLGHTRLFLMQGDITRQNVDAIVNAANSSLMGGGGVDGAIHRAGGPTILEECKQIRAMHGQCAPGEAVITGGGNLNARFVIHTVGPIWHGGSTNENIILANAYRNSLDLALQYEVRTISFPSISTGAYGYPLEQAAEIALTTVIEFCQNIAEQQLLDEVRFILFDQFTQSTYKAALQKLSNEDMP
ncbi:MAG: O-acetyl-ADP-ribose deacetylase [Candidatus Obscuribacterales bacterium]|nr:O-acetyl-ADP-ribose deacetylase [Candidatus Obscuribacterales bacterium]